MARKKTSTPIEAVTHKDKRTNIPTEELRDFVEDDETQPAKMTYPRDTSLDPQLVWKGKDEQDQSDLEVPIVPIYIQEKVHPKAILENLRDTAKPGEQEPELTLFDDFNGIEFEDLIDFYAHEQNWSNRMILGDSLTVMASLAEKEGLKGKVQMIYLDPPYGIKFGSNWQVSTRKRDVKDGKAEDMIRQPEQVKAFRDTWELGIHSYLAYLRDRLVVARELLTDSGSIFVQIGDENVHLVRSLMDEVFGSENFVSLITVKKLAGVESTYLAATADFLLLYAKSRDDLKYRPVHSSKLEEHEGADRYDQVLLSDGSTQPITALERTGQKPLTVAARRYQLDNLVGAEFRPDTTVTVEFGGKSYFPGASSHWKTSVEGLRRLWNAGRLEGTKGGTLRYRRMLLDFPVRRIGNVWSDISGSVQSRVDPKVYVVQTSTAVVQRCILMVTDPGDLVLDPTCGSGTAAVSAEQWGRRWITVDTSRVALALARTRLMSARFPYYLLADSPEGARKQTELDGIVSTDTPTDHDVRKGFVYKSVPHVTLKSIANNPDITEGMSREAIDAAIAKNADKEILYDQPYEDNKRLRVTGPFTVESLSPHRIMSDEPENAEERPIAEVSDLQTDGGQYECRRSSKIALSDHRKSR
jgi:adenine-specific DNA-methyltransferase